MDDSKVIELYAKYDSCRIVAEELGLAGETVRRVLIKNGVKRTGNRPKPQKKSRRKYCAAVVGMYYSILALDEKTISIETGIPPVSVNEILVRKYGKQRKQKAREQVDMQDIERQYLDGISTYEIAKQYGVHHATISVWMNQRGHIRGKGHGCSSRKLIEQRQNNALPNFLKSLEDKTGGKVSYVSGFKATGRGRVKLLCNVCGLEFEAVPATNCLYKCPSCYAKYLEAQYAQQRAETKKRKEQAKEKREQEREQERQAEYAKEKTCKYCGSTFHSVSEFALYCSKKCHSNANNCEHRHRARKYGVKYEPGITLDKLIKRDRNTCQICGKPCTKRIKDIGHYDPLAPTLDHIQPMAKGGSHTWDNVQLAHSICNSYKRDQTDETQVLEDIHNAQKQAIA